ncbi:hypothetical protein PWG71_03935 [Nocardiopsis sp. N85]|uniref:hypothetical protein n=1 Tax=Nocardiopsis sp. N85 TaxID=3029400 RepID=UPI00237F4C84|nr:hypothetical protein [Nocardiopsis sp. N85]MDE3720526.1 hypothetical protein [Nocardiopsis sp. N85]
MPESVYHQIHFAWADPTLLGRVGPGPAAASLTENARLTLRAWRDRLQPALTVDYRACLPDPADHPETLWARAYPDGQGALVYRWPGEVDTAHAWAIVGPADGLTLPRLLSLHENPNTRPHPRRPPKAGWGTMSVLDAPEPWERSAAPGAVRTRDRRAADLTLGDDELLVAGVASALEHPERPVRVLLAPDRADLWQAVQLRFLWGMHRTLYDVLTPRGTIPAAGWDWSLSTYDPVPADSTQHIAFGPPTGGSGPLLRPPGTDFRTVAERLVGVLRDEGGDALAAHLAERGIPDAPTFTDRRDLLVDWLAPAPAPAPAPAQASAAREEADGFPRTRGSLLTGVFPSTAPPGDHPEPGTVLPPIPEPDAPRAWRDAHPDDAHRPSAAPPADTGPDAPASATAPGVESPVPGAADEPSDDLPASVGPDAPAPTDEETSTAPRPAFENARPGAPSRPSDTSTAEPTDAGRTASQARTRFGARPTTPGPLGGSSRPTDDAPVTVDPGAPAPRDLVPPAEALPLQDSGPFGDPHRSEPGGPPDAVGPGAPISPDAVPRAEALPSDDPGPATETPTGPPLRSTDDARPPSAPVRFDGSDDLPPIGEPPDETPTTPGTPSAKDAPVPGPWWTPDRDAPADLPSPDEDLWPGGPDEPDRTALPEGASRTRRFVADTGDPDDDLPEAEPLPGETPAHGGLLSSSRPPRTGALPDGAPARAWASREAAEAASDLTEVEPPGTEETGPRPPTESEVPTGRAALEAASAPAPSPPEGDEALWPEPDDDDTLEPRRPRIAPAHTETFIGPDPGPAATGTARPGQGRPPRIFDAPEPHGSRRPRIAPASDPEPEAEVGSEPVAEEEPPPSVRRSPSPIRTGLFRRRLARLATSDTAGPDDTPGEEPRAPRSDRVRALAEGAFGGRPARPGAEPPIAEELPPAPERLPDDAPPLFPTSEPDDHLSATLDPDPPVAPDYATETAPEPDDQVAPEDNWPTQYVDLPLARLERWLTKYGPEEARVDLVDARAAVRAERAELQRVRDERDHYHAELQDSRREVARLDRPWLDGEEDEDLPDAPRRPRWPARVLVVILLVAFLATGLEAGARFGLGALDLLGSVTDAPWWPL